jgi:flagellar hook-associated protein 2
MASLSSAGIGSGLSVESIISSLMSIEKQPVTKLQSQQTGFQSNFRARNTQAACPYPADGSQGAHTGNRPKRDGSFSAYKGKPCRFNDRYRYRRQPRPWRAPTRSK